MRNLGNILGDLAESVLSPTSGRIFSPLDVHHSRHSDRINSIKRSALFGAGGGALTVLVIILVTELLQFLKSGSFYANMESIEWDDAIEYLFLFAFAGAFIGALPGVIGGQTGKAAARIYDAKTSRNRTNIDSEIDQQFWFRKRDFENKNRFTKRDIEPVGEFLGGLIGGFLAVIILILVLHIL